MAAIRRRPSVPKSDLRSARSTERAARRPYSRSTGFSDNWYNHGRRGDVRLVSRKLTTQHLNTSPFNDPYGFLLFPSPRLSDSSRASMRSM